MVILLINMFHQFTSSTCDRAEILTHNVSSDCVITSDPVVLTHHAILPLHPDYM